MPVPTTAPSVGGPASSTPVAASDSPGFHALHLRGPLLALAVVFVAWTLLHGDLWLADRLYAWEGHQWALRHAWLTEQVIHKDGRTVSQVAWLTVVVLWLVACRRRDWAPLRRPLLYLLTATAASTLLVLVVKALSDMDCPWDLSRYGGSRPYIALFQWRPAGLGRGMCFPAGHASGGYTWLALYFFLLMVKPGLRWWGLAIGLGAGLLFGISQQLRGAHFLSHDLAAVAICWTCAVVLHRAFWPRPKA